MGNATIFSSIDLLSGFYGIAVSETSKLLLAFTIPKGQFTHARMPMGAKGSAGCFAKAMELALAKLIGLACRIFLDDIIIVGTSIEDHYKNLQQVFSALQTNNMKVKLTK